MTKVVHVVIFAHKGRHGRDIETKEHSAHGGYRRREVGVMDLVHLELELQRSVESGLERIRGRVLYIFVTNNCRTTVFVPLTSLFTLHFSFPSNSNFRRKELKLNLEQQLGFRGPCQLAGHPSPARVFVWR